MKVRTEKAKRGARASRELVVNASTCSGCGLMVRNCGCRRGSTNNALSDVERSEGAGLKSVQLSDPRAAKLAMRAVQAARAGDSSAAAELHGKAAMAHDRLASAGDEADGHRRAAMANRRAAAAHAMSVPPFDDEDDDATDDDDDVLENRRQLVRNAPPIRYVSPGRMPVPPTMNALVAQIQNDRLRRNAKAEGSNADVSDYEENPYGSDAQYGEAPPVRDAGELFGWGQPVDEVTRENRRRQGLPEDSPLDTYPYRPTMDDIIQGKGIIANRVRDDGPPPPIPPTLNFAAVSRSQGGRGYRSDEGLVVNGHAPARRPA